MTEEIDRDRLSASLSVLGKGWGKGLTLSNPAPKSPPRARGGDDRLHCISDPSDGTPAGLPGRGPRNSLGYCQSSLTGRTKTHPVASTTPSGLPARGPRSAPGCDKRRVAFQGERGAFSEEAALKLLGTEIELVPRTTLDDLFTSIDEDIADYILAPFENSLAGSVHRSYDLLLESSLHINAEVIIPIVHHLIGFPGASFADIATVESNPVALAQCERFFRLNPHLKRLAAEDTAGSVAEIIKRGDPTRAAIAGRRAAEVYGGVILQEHLEDHPENYTRFVLLTPRAEAVDAADKLSLVIKLPHRPAALHHALVPFANRGMNLLKIESRPVKGSPWEYRFYLDLQASLYDAEIVAALNELRDCTEDVRVLGCYKADEFTKVALVP